MKKHKTYKAGTAIGMNLHGWGNGKNRKMPKGIGVPMGEVKANINTNYNPYYTG